jgi:hypothetical protein
MPTIWTELKAVDEMALSKQLDRQSLPACARLS